MCFFPFAFSAFAFIFLFWLGLLLTIKQHTHYYPFLLPQHTLGSPALGVNYIKTSKQVKY